MSPRQKERNSRHSGEGPPAIKRRMRTLNSEYGEKQKSRKTIPGKSGLPDMPEQEDIGRLIKQANEGNVQAQCVLGNIFYNGEGVRRNSCEALRWFRKAAEQGYDKAQNILGTLYAIGYEIRTPDYAGALKRYRTSKRQRNGNVEVQFYYGSYNIKQDYAEALKWFRKAAGQGCDNAQNNLGILYANGYGVEQDYTEALKWYRKAVEQGNGKAQSNLGDLYRYGHGVEQDYAEALKWYRKAAGQGVAAAWKILGNMYCRGEGVEKDFVTAAEWYRKYVEVMYPVCQGVQKGSEEDIQNEYNAVIQDCVIQAVNNFDRPVVIVKTQPLVSWDQYRVVLAVSSITMKVPFIMLGDNVRGEYLGGMGVGEDDDMDFIMRTEVTCRVRKGARHCYVVTIRADDYDKFVSSVTWNYIQLCKEKNKDPFTEYGAELIKNR